MRNKPASVEELVEIFHQEAIMRLERKERIRAEFLDIQYDF